MGASGFGYRLAQQFGHAVLPTRAGLVPLTLSGTHLERLEGLSGVSLPVEASCNGVSFNNFMLVTHRGLSGPSILQRSEEHKSELPSLMRISYAVFCLKKKNLLLLSPTSYSHLSLLNSTNYSLSCNIITNRNI